MLFNSFEFAIFFPVVTLAYFLIRADHRWALLLCASALFYMAAVPGYLIMVAILAVVSYLVGLQLDQSTGRRRTAWLVVGLTAEIGMLAVFKYGGWLIESLVPWTHYLPASRLVLPIGLSFHTFQAMSYEFDIYRGHQRAERHFGIYALYILFYPQLVAGPIERSAAMLPQLHASPSFDERRVVDGLQLMAWGLFKKVVIADRAALLVNVVYAQPRAYPGPILLLATALFAVQIYGDFAGYTDIARGAARVMGFHLSENFRWPYAATSLADFWHRWHISLSTWFRDYVYIPLGGNRVSRWRWARNVLVTFALSGLWHGANWTFLIWGLLHGSALLVGGMTRELRQRLAQAVGLPRWPRLHHGLQVLTTFAIVTVLWVWFRAANLRDAWYITSHLASLQPWPSAGVMARLAHAWQRTGYSSLSLAVLSGSIAAMEGAQYLQRRVGIRRLFSLQPWWLRWSCYHALLLTLAVFGVFQRSPFIYFQF